MGALNLRPAGIGEGNRFLGMNGCEGFGRPRRGAITSQQLSAGLKKYLLGMYPKAKIELEPISTPPPFFSIAVSVKINSHGYLLYLGENIAQFEAVDAYHPEDIVLVGKIIDLIGKFKQQGGRAAICARPDWANIESKLRLNSQ
jgi:uncharacterized membrane protein